MSWGAVSSGQPLIIIASNIPYALVCARSQPPTVPPPPPPPVDTSSSVDTNCHPSYPDVCLAINKGDYDCAGGSGNGPNYVKGPIKVLPPDPFGLDGDGDGIGCE